MIYHNRKCSVLNKYVFFEVKPYELRIITK